MLSVAAYTSGRTDPSARFRLRQHADPLALMGIQVTEFPSRFGSYPPARKLVRPVWGMAALAERSFRALKSRSFDVTLLQREMIATMYTAESLTARPRVVDIDDAIWLHGRGTAAKRLASNADLVLCGNSFLANYFSRWHSRIAVLPTAVDTDRYVPGTSDSRLDVNPVIGWMGSSSGFRFLYNIVPALVAVLNLIPGSVFRVIADKPPEIPELGSRLEFVRWSAATEVAELQKLAVGIMPLDDSDWARGKCSYKLLTYMACGIPVVASPIEMNREVLAAGRGLGPMSIAEWADALTQAISDQVWARRAAVAGREAVLQNYSVSVLAPRFASLLRSVH